MFQSLFFSHSHWTGSPLTHNKMAPLSAWKHYFQWQKASNWNGEQQYISYLFHLQCPLTLPHSFNVAGLNKLVTNVKYITSKINNLCQNYWHTVTNAVCFILNCYNVKMLFLSVNAWNLRPSCYFWRIQSYIINFISKLGHVPDTTEGISRVLLLT